MTEKIVYCEYFELLKNKCRGIYLDSEANITVKSPASIANLGPGFDIIGVALSHPNDILSIYIRKGKGDLEIQVEGEEVLQGKKNLVYFIAENFLKSCDVLQTSSIELKLKKGVPVSMGLGSSAASSVAIVEALRIALGIELSKRELILLSACGELYAAGALHYDNVSASYLGGMVLTEHNSMEFLKLPVLDRAFFSIIMPTSLSGREGKTMEARKLIPDKIGLKESIKQSSAFGKLISSLFLNDIKMFGEAINIDFIAEPYRKAMIPYYSELKKEALEIGALGFNIAGAGPSVFAVSDSEKKAEELGKSLVKYLQDRGISAKYLITRPSVNGVMEEEIIRSP
ncbi:MAG: homoserine kinase [Fervidicoccaceae archaeon]